MNTIILFILALLLFVGFIYVICKCEDRFKGLFVGGNILANSTQDTYNYLVNEYKQNDNIKQLFKFERNLDSFVKGAAAIVCNEYIETLRSVKSRESLDNITNTIKKTTIPTYLIDCVRNNHIDYNMLDDKVNIFETFINELYNTHETCLDN